MQDKSKIIILGVNTLVNQALSYIISNELGITCDVCENPKDLPKSKMNSSDCVVLCDARSIEYPKVLPLIYHESGDFSTSFHIALFNVGADMAVEEDVLSCGIKGMFYERDSLEHLLKGIRGILSGELWLQRRILEKLVLNAYRWKEGKPTALARLTPREMQILALVGSGATNDEIAKQLFISPHTVKTHLYNVFKKIEVPNRLQAALWIAKHL